MIKFNNICLAHPGSDKEVEAFRWIKKESEVAKHIATISIDRDGFQFCIQVPIEWSDDDLVDIMLSVKADYNEKFMTSLEE